MSEKKITIRRSLPQADASIPAHSDRIDESQASQALASIPEGAHASEAPKTVRIHATETRSLKTSGFGSSGKAVSVEVRKTRILRPAGSEPAAAPAPALSAPLPPLNPLIGRRVEFAPPSPKPAPAETPPASPEADLSEPAAPESAPPRALAAPAKIQLAAPQPAKDGDRHGKGKRGHEALRDDRDGKGKPHGHGLGHKKPADDARARFSGRGKRRRDEPAAPAAKVFVEVAVPEAISVGDLARKMNEKASALVAALFKLGAPATINDILDRDTAMLLVEELGHRAVEAKDDGSEAWVADARKSALSGSSAPRRPVVTVMGHVDHGKTSLLDAIRKTRVASSELGGITQSIGAYVAETPRGSICFIDTPGHAAFSAMRERGAKSTDIVILVVAADDGVMPQTREALAAANAAGAPVVVAVNKIDKPGATLDKVRQGLLAEGLVPEELGGQIPFVGVSALTGAGLDELLERVLLQAEIMELSAPADGPATGAVLESKMEKGRGPVSTVLVQTGTLKVGDILLAGTFHGRVKALRDCSGRPVRSAGPSTPVQVMGVSGAPAAGSECLVLPDERRAREAAAARSALEKQKALSAAAALRRQDLFGDAASAAAGKQVLTLLLKADSRGALEALQASLEALGNDEVSARVVASGVGPANESDALIAASAKALLLCFSVPADAGARREAAADGVEIARFDLIHQAVDAVKARLGALLPPERRFVVRGSARVLKVFPGKGFQIAGCLVEEGAVRKGSQARVLRGEALLHEGSVASLRRARDDASEVRSGTECGIQISGFDDFREGDVIEAVDLTLVPRTL